MPSDSKYIVQFHDALDTAVIKRFTDAFREMLEHPGIPALVVNGPTDFTIYKLEGDNKVEVESITGDTYHMRVVA